MTAERARSALDPVDRARLPSPNAVAQLLDEGVQLDLGPVSPSRIIGGAGLVDVPLQLDDPFLVGASGAVIEERAGSPSDIAGAHQLEGVDLDAGTPEQDRQVADPLGVAYACRPSVEQDAPAVAVDSELRGR